MPPRSLLLRASVTHLLLRASVAQVLAPRSRAGYCQHRTMSLLAVEYEVHGRVQGVWMRACTQEKAQDLGVVGWVANSPSGTVKGEVQGERQAVEHMKEWLAKEGSPHSRIERCDFRNERELQGLEYSSFEVRRGRL